MVQHSLKNVSELEVLNFLAAPMWIFDVENQRIWWANQSGLDFWQAGSVEELTKREYASDSANVVDRLRSILETTSCTSRLEDTWTLYPDGVPQTVVLSFRHALLEDDRTGLLVEVVRMCDDIMDDTARIADAVQSTPSLMTLMSIEGRVLVQNAAALKCYGPPLNPDSGKLDINFRYPSTEVSTQILSSALENSVLRFETEVQTRNGRRVHHIWIKRGRDPVTGDLTIAITEEDISEISGLYRKEIQRAAELEGIVEDRTDRLRITKERMQRGLQLAAIWDWDIESNQLFFSPNFIDLLEYEKEEFYEKLRTESFKSIINADDYVGYPAKLENILANPDAPLSLELRFITKSGKHLWIQIEGKCYCDTDGKPVRTAGLLTNVTHKKQLETKLFAAQKLEAIGRLTGGIAHDFNNLLTVIQGNIQLLQEFGDADTELTYEIVSAVQRGAELTRHLLAFAGKQSLAPCSLDVGQLLNRMRGTLFRVLSETIEISIEAEDDLWPVFADQAQTEAALLNLALNARDAMPNGGTLKVATQNLVVDQINTPLRTNLGPGEYVKISVTDTGTGMTPEVIEKACEPFFTTKEVGKGSGLGLSMVMGFSQQSGGDVQIESDISGGATISVYLPRAQQEQVYKEHFDMRTPKIGKGERVHILDDNKDVVSTVTRMGASLGYNVTSSTDVDHALDVAMEDLSINLFLIDVILPGGRSGVDFASELIKIRPTAKLILMSGYPQDEFLREITQTINFDFLAKPFSAVELSNAVARALKS